MALNPNDKRESQIYIYNNIFFSFATDVPENFSEQVSDTIPTY